MKPTGLIWFAKSRVRDTNAVNKYAMTTPKKMDAPSVPPMSNATHPTYAITISWAHFHVILMPSL